MFGGDDGPIVNQTPSPRYKADTWLFEVGVGWSEITSAGPSARGRYAVAYDPNGRRMLLFGGRFRAGTSGDYTLFNELWSFDFAAKTWTLLDDGSATAPAPRYFAAAGYDPASNTFYIYGGDTNPSALGIAAASDVWAYDASGWREIATSGTGPSSRLWVGYAFDTSRKQLVVFGGQVGDFVTAAFSDLYALSVETGAWSQLHAGGSGAPIGRFSSTMTYDATGDRYIVFGGHADLGVTNDAWSFAPGSGWSELRSADTFTGTALGCLGNSRELPSTYVTEDLTAPERRATAALGIIDGDMWMFGGESDCSDHLDDVWRLELASGTWTEVQEARSGESCARRAAACSCLCL